jgi:uncharacterized membrane protein
MWSSLYSVLAAPRDFLNGGTLGVFLLLTVVLAGGAAFLAGKTMAREWRPLAQLFIFMIPLAAGTRFLHYALYQEPLGSLQEFLLSYVILTAFALLGYRRKRTSQMVNQYPWLYQRTGPLTWTEKR